MPQLNQVAWCPAPGATPPSEPDAEHAIGKASAGVTVPLAVPRHFRPASLAQLAAQPPCKRKGAGSRPAGGSRERH